MHQGSEQVAFTVLTGEQGGATTSVEEQILALRHILEINLGATIHSRKDAASCQLVALIGGENVLGVGGSRERGSHSPRGGQELQAVSQADAHTVLGNFADGGVGNLHAFRGSSDPHNPLDFVSIVRGCWNDEQPGQEIRRNSVSRGNVVGTTNRRHAAI